MKLTYLKWGYPHDSDIIRAFARTGLAVETVELPWDFTDKAAHKESDCDREELHTLLKEKLRSAGGDIVFSVNFFAVVSNLCMQETIPYCSWVLQLPDFDLYTSAVLNECNYLGVCDSYLVERLWQLGASKSFFLPDAVEVGEGITKMPIEREACFIARYPGQQLNNEGMTLYAKGYLDAFIHAQRVLYGASILENGLPHRVQHEFMSCNPIPDDILPQMQKLFLADRYLAPVCTGLQQSILLQNFDSILTIYSDGDFRDCKSVKYPFVEEEEERRKIYVGKEFTLVLAPHIMHNAIPRDVLEVIAAGGFPLAGFQRDYAYFFKNNENLAYFTNPAELREAIVRYGNSHDERERVRIAAYQTVSEGHTYKHRIAAMLEMWEKL